MRQNIFASLFFTGLILSVGMGSPYPTGNNGLHAEEPASKRTAADEARLQAVQIFADNVLAKGKDQYGTPSPLFVDGWNVVEDQPVVWVHQGQEWIPSNLASQQNLFRTLVGLSELTGDSRYQQAARDAVEYHFEHLVSSCGLLRWGGHRFIDLKTMKTVGEQNHHELKFHFPFYEFLHEINPEATEKYLRACWNAHVLDWGILDMNRHGRYEKPLGDLWDSQFKDPDPFFEASGLTFLNCGSDLIYAGTLLYQFTGEEGALVWSKRLAEQYVKARHPETGLGVYQYSKPRRRSEPPATGPLPTTSNYGDRAENQFGQEFGEVALEAYMLRSPDSIYGNASIIQLQLAEKLGSQGEEFLEWTRDGLLAFAKYGYDPQTNKVRPMWADGTDLTDYVIQRDGYFGKRGKRFTTQTASPLLLWSYTLAARLSRDEQLWNVARQMAQGHGLGEIGTAPGKQVQCNLKTSHAHPVSLFAVLELHRAEPHPEYLQLARQIGDNILQRTFHDGFFLPTAEHKNANFNAIEPLALLALEAEIRGTPAAVPQYNSGRGYIHGPHDGLGRTTDATAIWAKKRAR